MQYCALVKRPPAAEQPPEQPPSEHPRLQELLAHSAAQHAEIERLRAELLAQSAAEPSEIERLRRENEQLRRESEDLRRLIADLQRQLSEAQRAGRRQAAPFRRERRKEKPAKPGRKPGHPGAQRSPPEHADRCLEAPPLLSCPDCGGRVIDHHRHENYQTDLPQLRPEITRFAFESGSCERCGKRVFSRHPEQISTATGAAAHSLGPRLRALVADLKGHLGVPLRKIQEILREQFHVEVTAGALAHSNARLAERAEPTLEQMKKALAREQVVSADETSWWVGALSFWLWVVCSESFTIYAITPNRCATVVGEILGEDFAGWLMRDGFCSYDARLEYSMLRCLLHLLHNAEALEDAQEGEAAETIGLFVLWLHGVFDLHQRSDQLAAAAYRKEAAAMVLWFEEFIQASHKSEANQRFADRLAQIRHQIVPILEDPKLPATNNLGERQIRPVVVHRKISAGNKTDRGAKTLATLASLAATCRQQAQSFAGVVQRILNASPGQPVLFWQAPDPAPS